MADSTNKTETVELQNKHVINGVTYEGKVEVEAGLAEDLKRNDKVHTDYLLGLNTNNPVVGDLGARSAA